MSGGGRTTNVLGEQAPKYNAVRIQTSTQGMVIPVVFGTTRITGNLIWLGDFTAIRQDIVSHTGGGKGGGGGSTTRQISYVYQLAFAMGLCEGPIIDIIRVWASKSKFALIPTNMVIFAGIYPQSPWSYLTTLHPDAALNYPGLSYVACPDLPAGDSATIPDFSFEVMGLLPAPAVDPNSNFFIYDLVENGLFTRGNPPDEWLVINFPAYYHSQWITNPYGIESWCAYVLDWRGYGGFYQPIYGRRNGETYKISFWYKFGMPGGAITATLKILYGAADWGQIFNHTDQDWHYYEDTFVETLQGSEVNLYFINTYGIAGGDLGGILGVEFWIYDVKIEGMYVSATSFDSNPGDIIREIVTNPTFGLGLSQALIDTEDYCRWCLASGFLLSPAFVSQSSIADHINRILEETFSTAIWHDGSVMKLIPYGDTALDENGVTWTPNLTPRYDLGDDDFLVDGAEEPIRIARKSPALCYNNVKIECLDRNNDYNIAIIEKWDQASIDTFLTLPLDTKQMHDICNPIQADVLAQLILQREVNIRNKYFFKLGWKYCLLEPMDIVTLTDSALGLNKTPVRIIEIEEDENLINTLIAEEFPEGVGNAVTYPVQPPIGYIPNYNVTAPPVYPPMIFLAPEALWADPSKPEIWLAATGAANWGGCDIYVSNDDATYQYAGTILTRPRIGILSAVLESGSDPDVVNTCSVDLLQSMTELLSGNQLDADNFITMCVILDGTLEIISYETATLTGTYKYDLTYLRRGGKGTQVARHEMGSKFLRLDGLIARHSFDSTWLHNIVYFKFCSFNIWKSGLQNLADVDAYPFVIQWPISDIMLGQDSVLVDSSRNLSDSGYGADSISVSK